jgi:REP-associated tyrosine transposase
MSHARQVFPGATVAVALACSERRFFLRPGRWENRKIRFLLAHYAEENGIELHGFVFMSNHVHMILTDPRGRLPKFMEQFNAMVARVLNRHLDRRGRLWESTPYRSWVLETREELLDHLVYLATNPVEAWLVKSPSRWPGLISLPSHAGTKRNVKPPPRGLFGRGHEGSALPASATLQLHLPPYFREEGLERYRRLFQRALDARLAELHARAGSYSGRGAVLRLDPFSAPKSARGGPSFGLIPALTNATREKRQELKLWREAVRYAFLRWQVDKTTEFPYGTYRAVVLYKAKVASS